MKLENYISDLLRNHNCVIVPNFGGFIANYKSAVIDDSRRMIHPPSKSILFNKNLINNDGLLANVVSESESLDYNLALSFISEQVELWNNTLKEGGRVELGEIGFLCKQNGTIFFEQSREVNLLLDAYGLSSINFVTFTSEIETIEESITVSKVKENRPSVPIEKEERILVDTKTVISINKKEKETPIITLDSNSRIQEVVVEKADDDKVFQIKPKSNKWKYIAVAVAIPFMFYSYWIPMETDFLNTGQIQFSDFNPIHVQNKSVYQIRDERLDIEKNEEIRSWEELTQNLSENVQVYNYQFDDELYIPVRLTTDVVMDNEIIDEVYAEDSYYIISGCFSVKNNANNLVSDLKSNGYEARILDKNNGLHRVTTGGFSTKNDADDALDKLRSQGFSGWILKN